MLAEARRANVAVDDVSPQAVSTEKEPCSCEYVNQLQAESPRGQGGGTATCLAGTAA